MMDVTEYVRKLETRNQEFLIHVYHTLDAYQKYTLWSRMLIDQMIGREGYSDGMETFTHTNYLEWKHIEPTIDSMLDRILLDIDEMFNPWEEGFEWDDFIVEANKRLGRNNSI